MNGEGWENLSKHERRRRKKELAREARKREAKRRRLRRFAGAIVVLLLIFGGYFWWQRRDVLPPTDIAGHIEQSPPAHILDKPMPLAIQKHMLEHADGSGPPGVVINYNCDDFACPPGFINELQAIAEEYPEFVYLAPFPGMSRMLAATRHGKLSTFDSLDRESLIRFIEDR